MNFTELRTNILVSLGVEARGAAIVAIREILTEENTDALIERLMEHVTPRLPFYLRWLPIGRVLDQLLPEVLLRVLEDVLE